MMGPVGHRGAIGSGGAGDVTARIAQIQSRIAGLTAANGPGPTVVDARREPAAPPTFDLAAATATAAATAASGTPAASPPDPVQRTVSGLSSTSTGADVGPAAAALAAKLEEHGRPWAPAITDAAITAGVEPALLAALVQHESDFDPRAVSHAGAVGMAQLMPGTAAGLGVDPHDPLQNLAGGARYLRDQLDRFGSVDLALAAYNAGPTRVAQAGGVPRIPETMAYVDRVTATWEQLR